MVVMSRPYIEDRTSHTGTVSHDLVRHLLARQLPGTVVVVTHTPHSTVSTLSKQWRRLVQGVQLEQARTLRITRVRGLNELLHRMQSLRMTMKLPSEAPGCGLYALRPKNLDEFPSDCHTVYVMHSVEDVYVEDLVQRMSEGSLLVRY